MLNALLKERNDANLVPRIVCKDGFNLSVQASNWHNCFPKANNAEMYSLVEVGYPSDELPAVFEAFIFDKEKPVYGFVPTELVETLIKSHGGFSHFI